MFGSGWYTGKAGGVLPRQPAEDFCVGHDSQAVIDTYDGAKLFDGVIEHVKVVVGSAPYEPEPTIGA